MGTYYRHRPTISFGGFTMTPMVKALLIANALLYFVPALLAGDSQWALLKYRDFFLTLVPAQALQGMVWQVATYMFIHGGFGHFFFNMLLLWMMGTSVEQTWGSRRFLIYYLSCGVAAGISVVLMAVFTGELRAVTVGSSGAIFGIIVAFGMLFPDAPVLFMLVFPMPAKYFAILAGFLEFFFQRTQPGSGISHIAHLGGMLFGIIYIKTLRRRTMPLSSYYGSRARSGRPSILSRLDFRDTYRRWKLKRARKKFEVYMRKHEHDGRLN